MMFERTISNRLAQQLVEDEKNGILLVGYAKEDSPAHHLLEAAKEGKGTEVTLDKLIGPQPINCDIERFRFSGHSHRRDLLRIVEQLKPKRFSLSTANKKHVSGWRITSNTSTLGLRLSCLN